MSDESTVLRRASATSKSVSEDEAAIQGIPRSRFGLVSEPPTLILKLDAALESLYQVYLYK